MQLTLRRLVATCAFFAVSSAGAARGEVVDFDTRTTIYNEGTPYGKMLVINPEAHIGVLPVEGLGINAGYQADVVSGASIKVRGSQTPDVISSATVKDFRQLASGGLSFTHKFSTIEAGYSYSTENDYRSNAIDASAKAELLQRTMELSVAWAHDFDSVCDAVQTNDDPTQHRGMSTHEGCFTADKTKTTHAIDVDAFSAGWTQLWSPTFATQLTGSLQLQRGFLSNPYREVLIGVNTAAQEYVPGVRVRWAGGARMNWYLRPLQTALRLGVRAYRDTWDVRSADAELELERYLFSPAFRVRARGRVYVQGQAAFYSDDYVSEPHGAYFTGNRDLANMHSVLGGLRFAYGPHAHDGRWILGLSAVEVSLAGDVVWFHYDNFTVDGTRLEKLAIIASLGLTLQF